MERFTKLFINNKFVDAKSGKTFDTIDPSTGKVICAVAEGGEIDIDIAVNAAHEAFLNWKNTSPSTRRNIILKIADTLEKEIKEFAEIECLDGGKPITTTMIGDLQLCIEAYRYYAGWADKICGQQIPLLTGNDKFGYTIREPIGVVGCIIPWNFPLLMLAWKLAPALALGCTVVVKPSEKTPLSALKFADLCRRCNLPEGVLNIVPGYGHIAGTALVRHRLVNKLAFTGSTQTAKRIQMTLLETEGNLKRLSLELGGKSALIIYPDYDLHKAAQVVIDGIFFNCGQCCIASSRVYIHKDCYEEFKNILVQKAKSRIVGNPSDPKTEQGPLIDEIQYNNVISLIKKGVEQGGTILTGGIEKTKNLGNGYYIQPTIFANCKESNVIATDEIFGPVVALMQFENDADVIARVNNSRYGLGAGICTKDITRVLTLVREIHAGTVYVNCWSIFDAGMPFGGYKDSGVGRELGKHALDLYTEMKSVVIQL